MRRVAGWLVGRSSLLVNSAQWTMILLSTYWLSSKLLLSHIHCWHVDLLLWRRVMLLRRCKMLLQRTLTLPWVSGLTSIKRRYSTDVARYRWATTQPHMAGYSAGCSAGVQCSVQCWIQCRVRCWAQCWRTIQATVLGIVLAYSCQVQYWAQCWAQCWRTVLGIVLGTVVACKAG